MWYYGNVINIMAVAQRNGMYGVINVAYINRHENRNMAMMAAKRKLTY